MARRRKKMMAEMNVVPYIDVMLVLLVIFMVTAPMMQTGVEVDAPDLDAAPLTVDNNQEPLIVSVDQEGRYFLSDGSEVASEGITSYIKSTLGESLKRPVYVRADETVNHGYVMQAMVAIQQAGAKSIGLMADPVSPGDGG